MRTIAFLLAGVLACVSLLADGPGAVQAALDGHVLTALFACAEALLPSAFLVFLVLPLSPFWNVAVGGLLLVRGMDHIVVGTDIGLWEHVPGQGDAVGTLLVLLALAIFANTLFARRSVGAHP
jgi:hypothetical protein